MIIFNVLLIGLMMFCMYQIGRLNAQKQVLVFLRNHILNNDKISNESLELVQKLINIL